MINVKKQINLKNVICVALLLLVSLFSLTGCAKLTPSIAIGFKKDGSSSGEYSEAIEEFPVGETFYCAVKVKLVTNKKKARDYTVEVIVPNSTDVQMTNSGAESKGQEHEVLEDEITHTTTIRCILEGSKEATDKKIMFKGIPFDEGEAKIKVNIYDKDGELERTYFREISFVYE